MKSGTTCNNVHFNVLGRKRKIEEVEEMFSKRSRCEIIVRSSDEVDPGINNASESPRDMGQSHEDACNKEQDNVRGRKRKMEEDGEMSRKRGKSSTCDEDIIVISSDEKDADVQNRCEDEVIFQKASSGNLSSRADFDLKYQQLGRIGAGGFGSVCKGYRIKDRHPVAIKHIRKEDVICKDVTLNGTEYNIILEVAFMLKLSGLPGSRKESGTVSLMDFYNLKSELILVMENPDTSKDLFQYCSDNGGTVDGYNAKLILRLLVDAAIHMHTQGVFHRDIKPQNVLITNIDGVLRVWIIDFGCSDFGKEESYDLFIGTREYAPPEFFTQNVYWSCPTTVWQLGMLLYVLLFGEPCDRLQIHDKITDSGLSYYDKWLLNSCLTMDPRDRISLEQLKECLPFLLLL